MAIYHFSAKIVSRGKGQSAVNTAAYIMKDKFHDDELRRSFDYSKNAEEVKFREIILPSKIRERCKTAEDFWNYIQAEVEKGDNAQLAKRLDFALPKDISRERQIALAHEYAQHLADNGYGVIWALHDKNGSNPHIDMLVTLRRFHADTETWGPKSKKIYKLDEHGERIPIRTKSKKDRHAFQRIKVLENGKTLKEDLRDERKFWQDVCNKHLAHAGIKTRIDCRSHQTRQIEARKKMTEAVRRHDYATAQKVAEESQPVFRTPQLKEFYFQKMRNPVIAEVNKETAKEDAKDDELRRRAVKFFQEKKKEESIKERKRDQFWKKRSGNRWRTRTTQKNQSRAHKCKPDARSIGRASAPPGDTGKLPPRTPISIYSDVYEMIATEHLNRNRVADQIAESFFDGFATGKILQGKGDTLSEIEKQRIRRFFRDSLRRGAFNGIPAVYASAEKNVAFAVRGARIGGNGSATVMRATAQMMQRVASVARLVPFVGKPISTVVNNTASSIGAASKVTKIVNEAIKTVSRTDKHQETPTRSKVGGGGAHQGGGQAQQQHDSPKEDPVGLPASSAEAKEERNNGLDDWKFLSEVARADKEMEAFLAEVFGGPSLDR